MLWWTLKLFKFSLQNCGGTGTMLFFLQMKGLSRNKFGINCATKML